MFIQKIYIGLLCFGLAIVLGHDFIPHHHEHGEGHNHTRFLPVSQIAHQDQDHGHNPKEKNHHDFEWSHFFSNVYHDPQGLPYVTPGEQHQDTPSISLDLFQGLSHNNFFFQRRKLIRLHDPPYTRRYNPFLSSSSTGLRAPPLPLV